MKHDVKFAILEVLSLIILFVLLFFAQNVFVLGCIILDMFLISRMGELFSKVDSAGKWTLLGSFGLYTDVDEIVQKIWKKVNDNDIEGIKIKLNELEMLLHPKISEGGDFDVKSKS